MTRAHPTRSNSRDQDLIDLGDGRTVEVGALLGKGSAAKVYRGLVTSRSSGVGRLVALKLYSSVSSDEAEQVLALLIRNTRRVACIHHPNIVRAYECGVHRAQPFVVSELVDGISLAQLVDAYQQKQRRLPLDLALFIACEVAEALSGARTARDLEGVHLGLHHHAVSAREVLLSWRGEVKVSDFEAGSMRAASSSVRSLRHVAGRVTSMAPEVAQGVMGDARSDVFSFGVLLRELLIGPRFPSGLSNQDAIRLAREGFVQPLTFQPHLPQGLVDVMLRALEVDPEARYPNACALAHDLRRVAFAMGVGDGRWFLRSALQREYTSPVEEVTAETRLPTEDEEPYEAYEGEVVELASRTKRRQ